MSIETMKLALEALESVTGHFTRTPSTLRDSEVRGEAHKAITALRAAIEQAEEQEPVAYGVIDEDGQIDWTCDYPFSDDPGWPDSVPLYTAPLQREWQGLMVKEIYECEPEENRYSLVDFARAIEAKLKEKNT